MIVSLASKRRTRAAPRKSGLLRRCSLGFLLPVILPDFFDLLHNLKPFAFVLKISKSQKMPQKLFATLCIHYRCLLSCPKSIVFRQGRWLQAAFRVLAPKRDSLADTFGEGTSTCVGVLKYYNATKRYTVITQSLKTQCDVP